MKGIFISIVLFVGFFGLLSTCENRSTEQAKRVDAYVNSLSYEELMIPCENGGICGAD